MHRRAFLAAFSTAVAGVAGCSSIGFPDGGSPTRDPTPVRTDSPTREQSPTPGDQPTQTQTQTQTPSRSSVSDTTTPSWASVLEVEEFPRATAVALETVPRTYALSPTLYDSLDGARVRMAFTETGTTENPPRLVASLRNTNSFSNSFTLEWTPPFGRLRSETPRPPAESDSAPSLNYRDALWFVPTRRHELVDDPANVALDVTGIWRHGGTPRAGFPERVRLEAGETVYGEYVLAGHPEGAGNGRPPGIYKFSRGQQEALHLGVWDTTRPGPEEASRFAGRSLPTVPDRESIAWYHEADSGTGSFLKPSTERANLPAAVEFRFVNHTTDPLMCGHWDLYKLHDEEWFHLGPYFHNSDCRVVLPGTSKRWNLHAFPGEALETGDAAVFGNLGGGHYAAVAGYGDATEFSAAVIELEGSPVRLAPTDDVTVERASATVTVTSPLWEDGEYPPSATVSVTRAESGPPDEVLIPEQVMTTRSNHGRSTRFQGLRNTLSYFDDWVSRVVLRTDARVAEETVGADADSLRVGLATSEQVYRVEIDRTPDPEES